MGRSVLCISEFITDIVDKQHNFVQAEDSKDGQLNKNEVALIEINIRYQDKVFEV